MQTTLYLSLEPRQGFHTTLGVTTPVNDLRGFSQCNLEIVLRPPPAMFADPYELALHEEYFFCQLDGSTELELPLIGLQKTEAHELIILVSPEHRQRSTNATHFQLDIPLHLRYGLVAHEAVPYAEIELPVPRAHWQCPEKVSASISGEKGAFERHNIITLSRDGLPLASRIPVGQADDIASIELGTVFVILSCFVFVARCCIRLARHLQASTSNVRIKSE